MYSAARVNQFEMKDMCFQFVINDYVSRQGNNVTIKYNLKKKFAEVTVLFSFIKAYSKPCETIIMKYFAKIVNG